MFHSTSGSESLQHQAWNEVKMLFVSGGNNFTLAKRGRSNDDVADTKDGARVQIFPTPTTVVERAKRPSYAARQLPPARGLLRLSTSGRPPGRGGHLTGERGGVHSFGRKEIPEY